MTLPHRRALAAPLLATLALTACLTGGGRGAYPPFPWPDDAVKKRVMTGLRSAEVQPLGRSHDRASSRAMIRKVTRPSLANLDYAAYAQNPVLHQPEAPAGLRITPGRAVVDRRRLFGKVVVERTITTARSGTPLTAGELARPLAFDPLVDYLTRWDAGRAAGLEDARAAVKAETWGLPRRPGVSLQQIAALYLHRPAGDARARPQLWVKIEFMPWARLFERMPDADSDGYPEIYGRLRADLAVPQVIERIVKEYQGRALNSKQVHTWANELASYWYPSHNTDVEPLGQARTWPLPSTESEVRTELAGDTIQDPTVVIKGKPHGKAIYNVFVIPGITPLAVKVSAGAAAAPDSALKALPVSPQLEAQRKQLSAELARGGQGSWSGWVAQLAPLHGLIRRQLEQRPAELKALPGQGGFIFYRRSLEYVVGGDLAAQPAGKNPLPTIVGFKNYLAGLGVDFLLVPVPTKSEVFPDKLRGTKLGPAALPVINPHARKLFTELTAAGVEVVDLLPAYLAARAESGKGPGQAPAAGEEPLYQPQDTHWTDRGLRLAAELIAARIKRYGWYNQLRARAVPYTLERVTFKRLGDLHSRLTAQEQRRYKPTPLVGHRVIDPRGGKPYDDDPASPIVILGDSFTGVYQRTYCENAGVSAHVAHQIQHPVDLVMSYGGGPNVRQKLLTRGVDDLRRKRLLIWIFAARDLYNYWEDWAPLRPQGAGE